MITNTENIDQAISGSEHLAKISLGHDSFIQFGGAERVFEAFHELFPTAPIYTLVVDKEYGKKMVGRELVTSILQPLYFLLPDLRYALPFIPLAVWFLKVKSKLLLTSSSSFIRNIRTSENTIHINYCHTPARFLWLSEGYLDQELPGLLRPIKLVARSLLSLLRQWDYRGAQRVTYFIANSREVQKRIKEYYGRDSVVIHPFVDVSFWRPTIAKQDYFLIAGRLHAHKNNEIVIETFNKLGLPLHIVGTGRQEKYLQSIAKPNIKFLGRVSDEQLRDEYSGALGFIYPQFEDFGLMPLEAASCGTATLGLARGGSLETVVPGVTGTLFETATVPILSKEISEWSNHKFNQADLVNHAQNFSKEIFKEKILNFIQNVNENRS